MKTDHDKVEELLNQALSLAPENRGEYLVKACGPDLGLRHTVECLLKANERAGGFLAEMPLAGSASSFECPGSVIDGYKLLEWIGEGGFGVVYLAEQTEPVKRHVALKVIKPGMDTGQVVARFKAERQALALMDHPHIAKVHDGGATDMGRPYFVMELVRGVAITQWMVIEPQFAIRGEKTEEMWWLTAPLGWRRSRVSSKAL